METPVTLVSCLYWLARTKWQHSGFPPNYDRYASWSQNFLSLDANIVIFTDDHYYPAVEERRKKYDPELRKTLIVRKKLEELEFYQKYFFQMSVLMSSPNFKRIKHADCADNMYPLYNVVQYNKISLMKEVKDTNPFGATHLMWMDCGSCRENLEKYQNKKFPSNTDYISDKVIHFSHNLDFQLCERKQDYFLSQIRNIQGTSWILPIQHVERYHQLISHELESTMADGYIGSDEKTYDSIYQNNKDIVQLVKCGWFQFFDIMAKAPEQAPVQEEQPPTNASEPQQTTEAAPCEQVVVTKEVAAEPVASEPVVVTEEQVAVESAPSQEVVQTEVKAVAEAAPSEEPQPCYVQSKCPAMSIPVTFCPAPVLETNIQASVEQPRKSWWRRVIGA
jgi:hypothetical protein